MPEYSPGLEGVIAGETAVSSITEEGLAYRGYPIGELTEKCSFEEVAYLLLRGELPSALELTRFREELAASRALSPKLAALVAYIPSDALPMDALRTAVSLQSHFDPEADENTREAHLRKATRLLGQVPALIGAWHRARRGAPARSEEGGGSHATYLLRQVTGVEPDPDAVRVMDASLILYAEHEFNASTFAARVTVSTLSDLHSGIVSGIGALKGPLHGGANEQAMAMLLEIGEPENAEAWIRERLARRERIMGFGHRVVRQGDVRAGILHRLGAELARKREATRWLSMSETIQALMASEKGLFPNVDFPCGWVYYMLGLPVDLYTPIFVASRVSGWAAHVIEQLDNNRLIRPRGLYVGAKLRSVPSLDAR